MLQITGQLSRIKPRLRRYLSFDYFHQKETKPTDKVSSRVSLRHLYYFTWKKNELVWLIPVTATIKSWSQMPLLARNENWWQGYKINKPVDSLRLPSKLHICPRSFGSQPNIHFSDNISAVPIINDVPAAWGGLLTKYTEYKITR